MPVLRLQVSPLISQGEPEMLSCETLTALRPPLEQGECLGREEFEARYAAMRPGTKAELFEGIVYMPSPAGFEHSRAHSDIVGWLSLYRAMTPGLTAHIEFSLRLGAANEVQPDAILRLEAAFGGKSRVAEDGYLDGPPELVVEVAATTSSYDLGPKFRLYEQAGVAEYIVWQVSNQRLSWFTLREGKYIPLLPDAAGVIASQVFPGLWLNGPALVAGKLQQVMLTLQQGLASPAYAAFSTALERISKGEKSC
jgi:Uma2 family endonuclease